MDNLEYGLYIFEFKYPHLVSESLPKIFRIEIFDYKNKKVYIGTLGDRSKLKDYCFNLIEYEKKLIIPINKKNFFELLETYVENLIGKHKSVLFNLIDANEWLI